MRVDTELSDEQFCRKALAQGVKISALSQYFMTPPPSAAHVFIINYSSLEEEIMEKAVEILYRIC